MELGLFAAKQRKERLVWGRRLCADAFIWKRFRGACHSP